MFFGFWGINFLIEVKLRSALLARLNQDIAEDLYVKNDQYAVLAFNFAALSNFQRNSSGQLFGHITRRCLSLWKK